MCSLLPSCSQKPSAESLWVDPAVFTKFQCLDRGGVNSDRVRVVVEAALLSAALFFLMGLAAMKTDHLAGVREESGSFIWSFLCLLMVGFRMLPPSALLLCPSPWAQTQYAATWPYCCLCCSSLPSSTLTLSSLLSCSLGGGEHQIVLWLRSLSFLLSNLPFLLSNLPCLL